MSWGSLVRFGHENPRVGRGVEPRWGVHVSGQEFLGLEFGVAGLVALVRSLDGLG